MPDVQVRIAVAVDANGQWNSYGWAGVNHPQDDIQAAYHALNIWPDAKLYWLTATLPVPEAQTVRAEVNAEPKE